MVREIHFNRLDITAEKTPKNQEIQTGSIAWFLTPCLTQAVELNPKKAE